MRDNGTVGEARIDPCYTAEDIAKAAGVRKSLILKYIREGVRGAGRLQCKGFANGEPLIYRSDLERFYKDHSGRAATIAHLALENLPKE